MSLPAENSLSAVYLKTWEGFRFTERDGNAPWYETLAWCYIACWTKPNKMKQEQNSMKQQHVLLETMAILQAGHYAFVK